MPESLKSGNRRAFELARANPLGAFKQLWHYPVVIALILVYFFYMLGHFALPSIWAFFTIEKFGWSPRDIGISLSAVGVAMIFVQAYLIRLVLPVWGPTKTAVVGLIATAAEFLRLCLRPVCLDDVPGDRGGFPAGICERRRCRALCRRTSRPTRRASYRAPSAA